MKKSFPFIAALSLILIVVWQIIAADTNYYLICVAVLILSMLPFFSSFERSKSTAREIALMASLTAVAVVGRALFYFTYQIKPIAAVVAISGICLGTKRGYLVGAFSMFISNFIFGQGIWTPFQMVAMGFVGLTFGAVFKKINANKFTLAVVGFLSIITVYGLIVDLSTVLVLSSDFSVKSVLSIYSAGFIYNVIFGTATAIFLFFFGEPFIRKINRLKTKYGMEI